MAMTEALQIIGHADYRIDQVGFYDAGQIGLLHAIGVAAVSTSIHHPLANPHVERLQFR
jgi:hypothetical protein